MKQRLFWLFSVLLSLCLLFTAFTLSSSASNTYSFEFDGNDVYTYYYTDDLPGRKIFTGAFETLSTIDSFYIESEIHLTEPIPVNKVFNVELGINMNAATFTDVSCLLLKADKTSASSNSYAPTFYGGSNGGFELKNAQADLADVEIIIFKVKVSYPSWTVINLPFFYCNSNTYYFENGMTWEQWVSTEYNYSGFYIESNQVWLNVDSEKYYVDSVTLSQTLNPEGYYILVLYEPEEPEETKFYCNYGGYYYTPSDLTPLITELREKCEILGNSTYPVLPFEFQTSGFTTQYYGFKSPQKTSLRASTNTSYDSSDEFYFNNNWRSSSYRYWYPTSKQEIPEWFYNWLNTYCTWHVTQNYPSATSNYDSGIANLSATSYVTYNYLFTPMSLSITEATAEDVSGGIFGFVKKIWQGIVNLPQNIASSIKGFFTELGSKITALGSTILEGIRNLFVPSESDITSVKDKFESLLSDRFGAVYDSSEIIDDFASVFATNGAAATSDNTISFPSVTVNLAGSDFTFGGWDVDIIPDGFEAIVSTLKLITSVVCTFLFVNGLRKRLDAILK